MNTSRSRSERPSSVSGWLLDLYPLRDRMILWFITSKGDKVRLTDEYCPRIYVRGTHMLQHELERDLRECDWVSGCRSADRFVNLSDLERSRVLEVSISDYEKISFFTDTVHKRSHNELEVYNADIPLDQYYLYEKRIFPLAQMSVRTGPRGLEFDLKDSVDSREYSIPPLRAALLRVEIKHETPVPRFSDTVSRICLRIDGEEDTVDRGSEAEKLIKLSELIQRRDPDIILTEGGDSFLVEYLCFRAEASGVRDQLILGRECIPLSAPKKKGHSFFSYGRVYYKAPMRRLFGRIHIDVENGFIYPVCGMEGLIEVARTCRVPIHRAARASIGTIMSSAQLYQACEDGVLIPPRKSVPEEAKTAKELIVADRGGFIFEPRVGVFDSVGEIDFSSMYPSLMVKKNISPETVLCKCCPESTLKVPELGWRICERQVGLIPRVLKLILEKRLDYKRLRNRTQDPARRGIYDLRQGALKWVLVSCFGYLGYRNARFGKIDSHIAVCAFARDVLLRTAHIAERRGFENMHGIVDCLWLRKQGAVEEDYLELCREIEEDTGLPIGFEGIYKWIVFLPSKVNRNIPVLNRYFGVFRNGEIKVRGIEACRSDTPQFICDAQLEVIKVLAKAQSRADIPALILDAIRVLRGYVDRLKAGRVDVEEFIIATRLSKDPEEYDRSLLQAIAAKQLFREGGRIHAGETIRYLIKDADNSNSNLRVTPLPFLGSVSRYDGREYLKMLINAASTVLEPFGLTREETQVALQGQKQTALLRRDRIP